MPPDFKARLDTCRQLVSGMHAFEVAIRTPGLEASCDVVLYLELENSAALAACQHHPHHQPNCDQQRPGRLARHPHRA